METIGNKLLFLILLVCVSVAPCIGRRFSSRFRSGRYGYGYYSYSRYSSGGSTGAIIGGVIGAIVVIVGIVILIIICRVICAKNRQRRPNATAMTNISSNVEHTMAPPPYSTFDPSYKTGEEFNTKHPIPDQFPDSAPNYNAPPYPNAEFTLPPYPDTTSCYPPQPYPANDNTAPPEFSSQPLSYDYKPVYDNQAMTQ